MIQSRQIAADLGLDMKIGDVEYQGDGNKAIFYYIADGRVDFRQLIRVLASTFHVRIEMKQIGARQEAGRIGGIGPCGRELCCASWMTSFMSVNTSAARLQDLSLNPQKLTGMCGKLKCCMNYEVNAYAEAQRTLPSREVVLETKAGSYYHFKSDNFQRLLTYSTSSRFPERLVTISAQRAFDVIAMNNAGKKPDTLEYDDEKSKPSAKPLDILEGNSLTRFDKKLSRPPREGKRGGHPRGPRDEGAEHKRRTNAAPRASRREQPNESPGAPSSERTGAPRSGRPHTRGGRGGREPGNNGSPAQG